MLKSKLFVFYLVVAVALGVIGYHYFSPKSITIEPTQATQSSQSDNTTVTKESTKNVKSPNNPILQG